jgi:hypothetical protein
VATLQEAVEAALASEEAQGQNAIVKVVANGGVVDVIQGS